MLSFYNNTLSVKFKRASDQNLVIILIDTFLINHKSIAQFNEYKNVNVSRSHRYRDSIIMASAFVTPAFALKRYFNCVTEIANKSGKLTLADVNSCYDKEFHSSSHASSSSSNSASTSHANGK